MKSGANGIDMTLENVWNKPPGLRRRLAAEQHVFADAALADVDTEFQQFAVDAGCTPTGILPAHLADQISDFARNDGSSEFVSGLTMASAERQSRQRRDRQIHNRRSPEVNFGRFLADL